MLAAVSIIFSVGVCLSGSWQLTLVLFLAIPMIIIAHQIEFSQYTKTHSKNDDSFTKAANLILETKDNMKTVLSLGVEEYLITAMKRDLGLHLRWVLLINKSISLVSVVYITYVFSGRHFPVKNI